MKLRSYFWCFVSLIVIFSVNATAAKPKVKLGIDVLAADKFSLLQGKRVGLLTHKAGVNQQGTSTVEVFFNAPQVNLTALFAPEHGLYGDAGAEQYVEHRTDPYTRLPVYSLYGLTRKPTEAMLDGIDVLVIDLQDIGVRSYTYASCMLYAMESCFEHGKPVVVLDRPNPLGGLKVEGPPMDTRWLNYVGSFKVPYVHGLTIGELAFLGMDQLGYLGEKGHLTVVPMRGWKRSMAWDDTGLQWVATSPNITSYFSALGYPMTGLGCQLGQFKHGIGSRYAFRMLSYPGKTPEEVQAELKSRKIPGLTFKVMDYENNAHQAQRGVLVEVSNWKKARLTDLNFHLMQIAATWDKSNPFRSPGFDQVILYNKHVGSDGWWLDLAKSGESVDLGHYLELWDRQAKDFSQWAKRYALYE